MKCSCCGAANADGVPFCSYCGSPMNLRKIVREPEKPVEPVVPKEEPKPQPKPEPKPEPKPQPKPEPKPEPKPQPKPQEQPAPKASAQTTQQTYQKAAEPAKPKTVVPDMPMKWYHFQTKFALVFGAITNILMGFTLIGTEGVNPAIIIGYFVLAILGFAARSSLAKYKINGPARIKTLYVCNILLTVLIAAISGGSFDSVMPMIIGQGIVLLANNTYFKKRRHLFVNV